MRVTYQLGIDTGGTYTDAVLVDAQRQVAAKQKSLTTHWDLSVGIERAVGALPEDMLRAVNLAALSTTLSTNSVVEKRGAPVCVLLSGYTREQVDKSGLAQIMDADLIHMLDGGHSATGAELRPLDLPRAKEVIAQNAARVSAFAVSSIFGVRNTAHETCLRDCVRELSGKPVACGHELALSLGAPRRALTAALNAGMISHIQLLIESVAAILQARNISAPLMIVKGDGSLVNVATALRQPLMTVLSGPAASVVGACELSQKQNAIVVDMGGTTTDIAVVADGRPELCEDGARIGDWRPMVDAIRVLSIGLGGDSELRFRDGLHISERRVVPMSLLAHQHPHVLPLLERQWNAAPSPRQNKFALRLQANEAVLGQLNPVELDAWEKLGEAPIELEPLAESDRPQLRALAKLERLNLAIYSGFTPSDATHVLGLSAHWNGDAAMLGAKIWARQMRQLYGYGNWEIGDARAACTQVLARVVHEICCKLIEAGLNHYDKLNEAQARNITRTLTEILLHARDAKTERRLFQLQFATDSPLVAVGAPAADYFPRVAELLGVELQVPEHADTANAVGAVMGAVVQSAQVTVTQPEFGVFYLFHKARPMRFENLECALKKAEEITAEEAEQLARAAGADGCEIEIKRSANHVKHDIDGELFVSATIAATATGRPRCASSV